MYKKLNDSASNSSELNDSASNSSELYNSYSNRESPLYVGDYKALIRLGDGHTAYVNTKDQSIAPHLTMLGYFSPVVYSAIVRNIKEGDTVVDVGANIGYMTMAMAKKATSAGSIIAYEASPYNFELLKSNILINGYSKHVHLFNIGIYNHTTELEFITNKQSDGGAHVYTGSEEYEKYHELSYREGLGDAKKSNTHDIKKTIISTTTLDESLSKIGVHAVNFMKIDIEGSDCHALQGANNTIKNSDNIVIVMEWAAPFIQAHGSNLEECANLIYDTYQLQVYKLLEDDGSLQQIDKSDLYSEEMASSPAFIDLVMYKGNNICDDFSNGCTPLEITTHTDL